MEWHLCVVNTTIVDDQGVDRIDACRSPIVEGAGVVARELDR